MKSFKLLLTCIVLASVAAAPVVRADTTPPAASAKLTPEQEAKIAALHKEERKAVKAVRDDAKLKESEKKDKIKAIHADYKAQIDAVKAGK